MPTAHDWESKSYQWGSVRGGRWEDAITWYCCRRCGAKFAHRYNIQPSIYEAMADQGVDNEHCDKKSRQPTDRPTADDHDE